MWETIAAAVAPTVVEGLFGKRQASKQMDFQAQQSATAYQRAVKDLRAAGLNPILAGTVGGASTPSGAMAPTPQFASNISSAIQSKRLNQELKNLRATENKTNKEIELLQEQIAKLQGGQGANLFGTQGKSWLKHYLGIPTRAEQNKKYNPKNIPAPDWAKQPMISPKRMYQQMNYLNP
jgi:hypothetical protein